MIHRIYESRQFEIPSRITHGVGAVRSIPDELAELNVSKPLIATDPGVIGAGLLETLTAALEERDVPYAVFDKVKPNPPVDVVGEGTRTYESEGCDGLIGLGGGSSMDTAKGIALEATHEGSVLDYEFGKEELQRRVAPLITVPTTAGTGSEVTLWAVITDPEREFKFNVGGALIGAHVAVLDPELHVSMPPWVTAGTGIDVICQAYECYTCHFSQPHTEAVALYALELSANYLRRAFASGTDIEARYYMAVAANLGGLSYDGDSAGAVHAMAQTLGGIYPDTQHGLVVAAMLPRVFEFNWQGDPYKHRRVAEALGMDTSLMSDREASLAAVQWLQELNDDFQIPSLEEQGVDPNDVERLAREAANDPQTTGNVRDATHDDYVDIYTDLLQG